MADKLLYEFYSAVASWLQDQGEFDESRLLFRRAARAGEVTAQISLGYIYAIGQGVPASPKRALVWYKRAVASGHGFPVAMASNNIGVVYRDLGKYRLALRWFRRAVRLGDREAPFEIAKLYAGPLLRPSLARKHAAIVAGDEEAFPAARERAKRLIRELNKAERPFLRLVREQEAD